MAVARILNTSAWLKETEKESRRGKEVVAGLQEHLLARRVTFWPSVVGESKRLGIASIGTVVGNRTVASISRLFSRPQWQARLPNLLVDSKANGKELTFVLTTSISKQVTGRNPFIWVVL